MLFLYECDATHEKVLFYPQNTYTFLSSPGLNAQGLIFNMLHAAARKTLVSQILS